MAKCSVIRDLYAVCVTNVYDINKDKTTSFNRASFHIVHPEKGQCDGQIRKSTHTGGRKSEHHETRYYIFKNKNDVVKFMKKNNVEITDRNCWHGIRPKDFEGC